ncbi:MAG TPA: hypothetical protein VID48_06320 [Solirubrobacteraceae bacterium]
MSSSNSRLTVRFCGWLLTGPVGHLLGGALDFTGALGAYLISRMRARLGAQWTDGRRRLRRASRPPTGNPPTR